MKVAILHDDFAICGGGEKLVSLLADGLQNQGIETDIYTFDLGEQTRKIIPPEVNINILKKREVIYAEHIVKRYLFSCLNLSGQYDYFVFSGHSVLTAAQFNKPNVLYAHNIPKKDHEATKVKDIEQDIQLSREFGEKAWSEQAWRSLYQIKNRLIKTSLPDPIAQRVDTLRLILLNKLKLKDFNRIYWQTNHPHQLDNIEQVVCNSRNIQQKFLNHYQREAEVVYPPISTEKYSYQPPKNYWLSVNRITPLKRIELQLGAFQFLPEENLKIVGDFENQVYFEKLLAQKPPNVEFVGVVDDEELLQLYAECKGFLFTAYDEDFGMTPVEAMACGKPVIAPNEGGCRETIVSGQTGLLLDNIDSAKIMQAVKQLNPNLAQYKNACQAQAQKFDTSNFVEQMIRVVSSRQTS